MVIHRRASLQAFMAALGTVLLPSAALWHKVEEPMPQTYGAVIAAVGAAAIIVAVCLRVPWTERRRRSWAMPYGTLAAATCAAVAIAASSPNMVAEGQLAAIEIPIAFLGVGAGAAALAMAPVGRAARRRPIPRGVVTVALVVGSGMVAWRLPVVQFASGATDAIYPPYGGWAAFVVGLLTKAGARAVHRACGAFCLTVVILGAALTGYLLQSSFGIALVALGSSTAFALDVVG